MSPLTHPSPLPHSSCWEHHLEQELEAAPDDTTSCLISVADRKSHSTMVCPASQHAWFHRGCIQVGALPLALEHGRCSAAAEAHSCSVCLSSGPGCKRGFGCF